MKRFTLAPALAALVATTAVAGPADYVITPAVEYGERELELNYGGARKSGEPTLQAASLSLGYGATPWWFTEFGVKAEREGTRSRYDAVEWENKFQLTETGRYPIDVGFLAEFEFPHDRAEGNEFRFGPLFQAELDRYQFNVNLLLTSISRAATERTDDPNGTYFGYQWQIKCRWHQAFEFGAQGFGETGRWNRWSPTDEQTHRLGPAVFGKFPLGGRQALVYNAALLFGVTQGAPDRTFRLQTEYEF